MTHAGRGHKCSICGKVSMGNGGKVSHGRKHVRAGEAVELVRYYPDTSPTRVWVPADDAEAIAEWRKRGLVEEGGGR